MSFLVGLFTGLAAVSLPVMYIIERKCGLTKRMKRVHGILFGLGLLSLIVVCILFKWKVSSTTEDIGGWADDFFFSCFTPSLVCGGVITGILCGAAAIRHNMKRMRMTIAILLPWVLIAVTLFMAFLGENGYFAVDFYVRATAPGLALLTHAVPMCERAKKSRRS